MQNTKKALIDLVDRYRRSERIRQKDLALRMNCTQSRISRILASTNKQESFDDVFEILEALGLDYSIYVPAFNKKTKKP